ncbi:hypothetical protein CBR_g48008 [Chara braunii]|uniref:Uncharacterized protein n=1 Tax=Chara braunii TaxID=69332 RepID=A0A388M234_CHABU|nr:hypothetical protein CBR_g48008 [Chara braunii]|eukprot:GBG88539.1 hypothetical protein CBR_g48008 [Chara braunii]
MASSSQPSGSGDGDGTRRNPQTCYSCHLPSHYARDSGAYWKEKYEGKTGVSGGAGASGPVRGRSTSPVRRRWESAKRSPSADLKYRSYRSDEKDSVKDLVSLLMAEREEKERAKKEEEDRVKLKREKAEKEARRLKKEEKCRREQQENDERLKKKIDLQFAKRWGGAMKHVEVDSSLEFKRRHRRYRKASRRGKHHWRTYIMTSDSDDRVSDISQRTRLLHLTEKRKRTSTATKEEDSLSQSSPNVTPLKIHRARELPPKSSRGKSAKKMKTTLKPVTMKKLREKNEPKVKGAVAGCGDGSRLQLVKDTAEHLDGLDYRVIQKMCKREGLPYVRKGQAVMALAEKKAQVAYEGTKDGVPDYAKSNEESATTSDSSSSDNEAGTTDDSPCKENVNIA